jgi:hypothetical protein
LLLRDQLIFRYPAGYTGRKLAFSAVGTSDRLFSLIAKKHGRRFEATKKGGGHMTSHPPHSVT